MNSTVTTGSSNQDAAPSDGPKDTEKGSAVGGSGTNSTETTGSDDQAKGDAATTTSTSGDTTTGAMTTGDTTPGGGMDQSTADDTSKLKPRFHFARTAERRGSTAGPMNARGDPAA